MLSVVFPSAGEELFPELHVIVVLLAPLHPGLGVQQEILSTLHRPRSPLNALHHRHPGLDEAAPGLHENVRHLLV